MSARPLIFIATPCYGGMMQQGYVKSLLDLLPFASTAGFDVTIATLGHDALITRARNTLTAQFLAVEQATHLFFIDSDITFEPIHVHRLLLADKQVVAGMYPLKVLNWDPRTAEHLQNGEDIRSASLQYVGHPHPAETRKREGTFITGDYCGTGFMMIRRDAVVQMNAAYPELLCRSTPAHSNAKPLEAHALFECMIDKDGTYLSEDFAFCQRWRDIGGEIWLDTQGRLTHTGAYEFPGNPEIRFMFE